MTDPFVRLDKWLWHARFFKSRTLASRLCAKGRVRIDGEKVTKAHATVRPGQVLTFPQARDIRVVRVVEIGTRRGPATEARALYEDLATPAEPEARRPRNQPEARRPRNRPEARRPRIRKARS